MLIGLRWRRTAWIRPFAEVPLDSVRLHFHSKRSTLHKHKTHIIAEERWHSKIVDLLTLSNCFRITCHDAPSACWSGFAVFHSCRRSLSLPKAPAVAYTPMTDSEAQSAFGILQVSSAKMLNTNLNSLGSISRLNSCSSSSFRGTEIKAVGKGGRFWISSSPSCMRSKSSMTLWTCLVSKLTAFFHSVAYEAIDTMWWPSSIEWNCLVHTLPPFVDLAGVVVSSSSRSFLERFG